MKVRFGNTNAFYILFIVVPVFAYLCYRLFAILRNIRLFADKSSAGKLSIKVNPYIVVAKYVFLLASMVFFVIALARPWGKPIKTETEAKGIDIMVTMDVSSSMAAGDVKPSRMDAVKDGLKSFVNTLSGDRVGMITFAGIDFIQCPLTLDYDAMDLIIDGLSPGMLAKDGTAIGNAIKSSVERLQSKGGKSKIIILITDGDNNQGMSPLDAAKIAKDAGIRVYTIGVGTAQGGKIPEGRDAWGRVYYKIYQGQEVISQLDDTQLRQVAGITGGKYYRFADAGVFNSISADIMTMELNDTKIKKESKFEENYAQYLLAGLVLFVLYVVL
jgi:Ca-activated chloride channel family protein